MAPNTRGPGAERPRTVPMAILLPPRDQVVPETGVRCRGRRSAPWQRYVEMRHSSMAFHTKSTGFRHQ
eukprot:3995260-Alexandrium_andersonii.AAC.1